MGVPLLDLKAQWKQVGDECRAAMEPVLDSAYYVMGPQVKQLESEVAAYSGTKHAIGCANGSDAIVLALMALGVGPGDEVILPANTFIATAAAVVRAGATPALVDCDPVHLLIDPERTAARVTSQTKAIIPVHLYGQAAPVEALGDGVAIVEDAAQVQGAKRDGRSVGGFGIVAGTSFYPGKNLGAYGDAGAVLTNADDVAQKVRALRNYGSEVKYAHPEIGFNSRLDPLQAVVLTAKLRRLAAWNDARRAAARRYDALLADVGGVGRPSTLPGNEHVWHLYVVRVPRRDDVLRNLNAAGIGAGIHYPVPIHLQGAFAGLGHQRGDFPVAEAAADEILSLPLYPHITAAQQERVVEALRAALV